MKVEKIEILQKKISKIHNDSFWYNGEIAKIGNWYLVAVGDIEIHSKTGEILYARGDKYYDEVEFKNDKDLNSKVDYDNAPMVWEHNNWFEVINYETGEGGLGFVTHTYDTGIKLLEETVKGDLK